MFPSNCMCTITVRKGENKNKLSKKLTHLLLIYKSFSGRLHIDLSTHNAFCRHLIPGSHDADEHPCFQEFCFFTLSLNNQYLSTQNDLEFDYAGLLRMHLSVLRISTVNGRRQIPSCQTVGCLQPYLGFSDASCSVTASARLPAHKLFQRGEPKKGAGVIRQG